MSQITAAIELVQSVFDEVGAAEFSRASGVAYTTIVDSAARGFKPKPVAVLERLAEAALAIRAKGAEMSNEILPSASADKAVDGSLPHNAANRVPSGDVLASSESDGTDLSKHLDMTTAPTG